MTHHRISVVVPTLNVETYVGEALESILGQSYPPFEVIVVDGGSTDATPDIVRALGDPVRYVLQPLPGLPEARNFGVEMARGDLIASLDADDLWHADKLAQQVALLDAQPDVDICLTHLQNRWIDDLADEAERLKDSPRAQPLPGYIFSTILASKGVFDRVGPCATDKRHTHVAEWFLRAQNLGLSIEVLPAILMWHRLHHDNMTRREETRSRSEFLALIREHLEQKRSGGQSDTP